ncbi:RrF2 family transcriptional regulator [Rugosimonospora acidiphila]
MELPQTVEWALHCCWLLALLPEDAALPTRRLAEYHGIPEAYLAKLLKTLTRDGLLAASPGPRGGYRLARPAEQITVLDVVRAVEGQHQMFRCAEIRQRGPVPLPSAQCRRPCGIASVMHQAERAWRDALAARTVAELVTEAGTGSHARAARWLGEVTGRRPGTARPSAGRGSPRTDAKTAPPKVSGSDRDRVRAR